MQSISNLAIGTKINCLWNDTNRLFTIVAKNHDNYPANTVTLLCDTVPVNKPWSTSWQWQYANSSIRSYVTGEGFQGFDAKLREAMVSTTLMCASGNKEITTVSDKLFIPSNGELFSYSGNITGFAVDGTKYAGVSDPCIGSEYWVRSTSYNNQDRWYYVPQRNPFSTATSTTAYSTAYGVRFVFNVANTNQVTDAVQSSGGYEFVWNTAPTTPSSITVPATINNGASITVSWGASTDSDGNLSGYRLERSASGGAWTQVYQGTALSSSQVMTAGWTTVAFRVKAYDALGLESGYSTSPTRTINTAPTTPASITVPATIKGGESISVSWAASTDAQSNLAGYRLERSVAGGAWSQVYQGTALSSTQAITKGWTTVAFRVKAYDTPGLESGYVTSPTRTIINNSAPAVPGSINVPSSIRANTSITISWTASTDVDGNLSGYRLERSVDGGGYTQVYQGTALSSSQAITAGWKTVAFRVKAYDAEGLESGYRTGSVITINRPPTTPGAITCTPVPKIGRTVTLACGASTDPDGNAIQYVWERSVDGGAYTRIGVSSQPTITDVIPMNGLTYRVRVKAMDSVGDESAYSNSAEMEILYNEPPTTPGAITYAAAPREGNTLSMTCGISTDSDGDEVRYMWERKTDTAEYQLIGVTEQTTITDTVPNGCSFYQVRVKAMDSAGKHSDYATGAVLSVLRNQPPIISGEDVNLENQTAAVQHTYTITDADADETLTVTERVICGDKEWILRTFQAESGTAYTADTSSVWLQLIGGAQLVIEVRDFLNASAVRTVSFTRIVERIAASRSFPTGQAVEKCLIAFDPRTLPEGCHLTLQACNNPFDQAPVWEDITDKANKAIHNFSNTSVSEPGLAYRFIVTKGEEMAKIDRVIVKYS